MIKSVIRSLKIIYPIPILKASKPCSSLARIIHSSPDGVADLGYHAYPVPDAEAPGEVAAVEPPADDLPPANAPAETAIDPVVRRTGSPVVMAAVGIGILLILLALFLLIP